MPVEVLALKGQWEGGRKGKSSLIFFFLAEVGYTLGVEG